MRAASRTADLGSGLPGETVVDLFPDVLFMDRLVEAWPAGSGLELVHRAEQMKTARCACVDAGAMIVRKLAGERALGTLLTKNIERFRSQDFLPRFVRLHDLLAVEDLVGRHFFSRRGRRS